MPAHRPEPALVRAAARARAPPVLLQRGRRRRWSRCCLPDARGRRRIVTRARSRASARAGRRPPAAAGPRQPADQRAPRHPAVGTRGARCGSAPSATLAGAVALEVEDDGPGIPEEVRVEDLRPVLHDEAGRARAPASACRSSTASSPPTAARSRCEPRRARAPPSASSFPPERRIAAAPTTRTRARIDDGAAVPRGRILVVDDEDAARRADLRGAAEPTATRPSRPRTAPEALAAARASRTFDLVVSDVKMPGIGAASACATEMERLRPELASGSCSDDRGHGRAATPEAVAARLGRATPPQAVRPRRPAPRRPLPASARRQEH